MKVALYARYSSDNQRDASITDQLRMCRLRAEKEGWTVVEEYSDHALSGSSMIQRSGLQALILDSSRGRFDLILAMENSHIQHIRQIAPEVHGKTFLIGKWQDNLEIPDPYRQSKPAFEHVHNLLTKSVESWLPYLK